LNGKGDDPPPEKRSPANATNVDGAGSLQGRAGSPQRDKSYTTRAALLKQNGNVYSVSVYDGPHLAGFVVAPERRPAYAFDRDERFVGTYPNRKAATAALPIGEARLMGEYVARSWPGEVDLGIFSSRKAAADAVSAAALLGSRKAGRKP
jgi:hypothetical protein